MKIIYRLLIASVLIALPSIVRAQLPNGNGKPLYRIMVERDGAPLGEILLELYPDIAPLHVRNFDSLVGIGFYDSTAFHRVIPGFVIQGGDPNTRSGPESTWGMGDPGQQTVPAEFTALSHTRGALSAARSNDPNSATSQFFICHANALSLDGRYSVYGRVTAGMDVVDTIALAPRNASDRPLRKITMKIRRIGLDTTSIGPVQTLMPLDSTRNVGVGTTFSWSPVPGAILYQVQVATKPDFSDDTVLTSVGTSIGIGRLKPGNNTYYWRVRATNGGRHGEPSQTRIFTTGVVAPKLDSPRLGEVISDSVVTLRWIRVPGATGYRLQVATSLNFSTLLLDSSGITDTSFVVRSLATGARYYWRVRSLQDTFAGPVSSIGNFTLEGTSGVEAPERPAALEMRLVLGIDNSAALHLSLARAAEARVIITDLQGRDLRTVRAGLLIAGSHIIPVDLSELPAGTYLLRLESSDGAAARTFQITR